MRGEAKSALDSLQIVGTNYQTAWGLLKGRFEQPRLLVQDHLMALRNLKPLREESSTGLQGLLDTLERHRDQLRSLGRPVEYWDDWFLSFAATSMDVQTRRGWEDEVEKLEKEGQETNVTFLSLTDFLRRRCRTLNSVEGSRPTRIPQPRSHSNSTTNHRGMHALATRASPGPCVVCKEPHYLGHCERFKGKSCRERAAEKSSCDPTTTLLQRPPGWTCSSALPFILYLSNLQTQSPHAFA